ncbi:MAG: hypothetical protein ACLT98_11310 [Eggerthellaceae bacterium]
MQSTGDEVTMRAKAIRIERLHVVLELRGDVGVRDEVAIRALCLTRCAPARASSGRLDSRYAFGVSHGDGGGGVVTTPATHRLRASSLRRMMALAALMLSPTSKANRSR